MARSGGFLIGKGQTVVFQGDSITDAGRRGHAAPFGEGYVQNIIDLIQARYCQRGIRFINRGISGETTVELRNRWADDVIAFKPDWVSIMIGINDCHRFLFHPENTKVPVRLYRENYAALLERTARQTRARLIMMDPFYVSLETDASTRRGEVMATLPKYIKVVRDLARQFGAIHVPLHDIFGEQLKYRAGESLAGDAVHPTKAGHLLTAWHWLKAVGW